MGAEAEAKSGLHGATEVLDEFVDMAADLFAPIAGLAIGFFAFPKIGGPLAVANVIWNGLPDSVTASSNASNVSWGIWLAIAAIFDAVLFGAAWKLWAMSKGMKALGKAVARFFSGAFAGWGVAITLLAVQNKPQPAGFFESVVFAAEG